MPFLETEPGVALHFEESGHGPPLVLVHGWSMSCRAFTWQLEGLAASRHVVAVDLRGHGDSTSLADLGHTIEDHARDLCALFAGLGLARTALVGWSMGAQVALEALPALGKRVVALGLLSATPCFTSRRDWPHGLPEPSVRALLARLAHRPEKALQRFFGAMFQPGEIDEKRRAEIEERTAHSPPALAPLRAALEALIAADQRSRLREVKVPTLLIHGECDPICLPGASSFAASHIRGARRLLLPGVGHAPQLSRPELVNELLLRFLSEAW